MPRPIEEFKPIGGELGAVLETLDIIAVSPMSTLS